MTKKPRTGSLDWLTDVLAEEDGMNSLRRFRDTKPSAYIKLMSQIVRRITREQDKYARRKAKLKT